jgi:hypothetical protein
MKLPSTIFATLFTICISNIAQAQDGERLEDLYLKGKWTASCATAIVDRVTLAHCELCSFIINPNDRSSAAASDVEMTFNTDSLILSQSGKTVTVPYTRNKDNHSFDFTLNNKPYHFRLFLYNKQRIIEDGDGMLMVLEKAK